MQICCRNCVDLLFLNQTILSLLSPITQLTLLSNVTRFLPINIWRVSHYQWRSGKAPMLLLQLLHRSLHLQASFNQLHHFLLVQKCMLPEFIYRRSNSICSLQLIVINGTKIWFFTIGPNYFYIVITWFFLALNWIHYYLIYVILSFSLSSSNYCLTFFLENILRNQK